MNKLTPKELVRLVENICLCNYKNETELDEALFLLESNVLDPEVVDYIYNIKYSLTPEEIVEKALSYKPIITPPPRKND